MLVMNPPQRPTASAPRVVHVEPLGADLELEAGETIIEAAWRLGYYWPTVCYGQAQCTLCHIEVLQGEENLSPLGDEERQTLVHRLGRGGRRDITRLRLACRAQADGGVTVRKEGVRRPDPPPSA
jgi:2Fe-2S ferredoxin